MNFESLSEVQVCNESQTKELGIYFTDFHVLLQFYCSCFEVLLLGFEIFAIVKNEVVNVAWFCLSIWALLVRG